MSEHHGMDSFDTGLTKLVRSYTDAAVRPVDPLLTARAAMASTSRGGALGRLWPVGLDHRLALTLLAAALLIAIAALAVAVGTHPAPFVPTASGPGRIVFIRAGDLFVVDGNGANERRVASGAADATTRGYLTALWSPDARRIAAVRGGGDDLLAPRIDIMSADGALSGTLDLEPGGTPMVAWSPDGTELAVASLSQPISNGNVPRRRTVVDIFIVGTNGVVNRKLDLPPDVGPFVVDDGFGGPFHNRQLAWSPDGRWISLPPADNGQGFRIIDPDGSSVRDLLTSAYYTNQVGAKEWAPDGRRITFINGVGGTGIGCPGGCPSSSVWTVGVGGGPVTFLVGPTVDNDPTTDDEMFSALAWSPDGLQMAIVSDRPTEEDLATKASKGVASHERFDPRLGRRLPVTSGTFNVRGDHLSVAGNPPGGPVFWTPDGRRIFYVTFEPGIIPLNPALGGQTVSIASTDSTGGGAPSIVVRDVQTFDVGFPD
jgi:Tol biopolymer transport system component